MKKVFLAVLAAGLFFACGNDKTNDQANEEVEAPETEVEAPVAEEPVVEAEAPVVETKAAVAENKSDNKGTTVKADKDGKVSVESDKANVEANKDGGLEIKINTKGKNSKGNR
ncbi:MAG: hypothetical protein MJZ70_08000 [Bacteroidales bacterium]|nr:hypothetical protein [Bacteroidales bacterium]